MIVSTLTLTVPDLKAEEVERTLRALTGPTAAEPGCQKCSTYRDIQRDTTFTFFQIWSSELQLRHFLRSTQYTKVLALIDLANEPPEICFYDTTSCEGMEVIKGAREWA